MVHCQKEVFAPITIQGGVSGCDVDGLLDPFLEPSVVSVQDGAIVLPKLILLVGKVGSNRGRLCFVFSQFLAEVPLCFTHVGFSHLLHLIS